MTNRFIIPKGTILKSNVSKIVSDLYLSDVINFEKNQYYSLFINENDTFLELYKKYYKTYQNKCNTNQLNLYIVKDDLMVLKWPDDLYSLICTQTDNEKEFIKKIFNLAKNKYREAVNKEDKNRYKCYLRSIKESFIDKCIPDFNIEPQIKKEISDYKIPNCDMNPDYNLDKLFDEFKLNGWLRFNQAIIRPNSTENVDEIMLTKTYLNTSPKKIDLMLSIDCTQFTVDSEVKDEIKDIFDYENLDKFTYYNGYTKDTINKLLHEPQKNPYPLNKDSYKPIPDGINYNYIYRQKYLKYKQKYLKLKNKII